MKRIKVTTKSVDDAYIQLHRLAPLGFTPTEFNVAFDVVYGDDEYENHQLTYLSERGIEYNTEEV